MSFYFKKIGTGKALIAALANEAFLPNEIKATITKTLEAGSELAGPSVVYFIETHGHLNAAYPSTVSKLEVTILDPGLLLDVTLPVNPPQADTSAPAIPAATAQT